MGSRGGGSVWVFYFLFSFDSVDILVDWLVGWLVQREGVLRVRAICTRGLKGQVNS